MGGNHSQGKAAITSVQFLSTDSLGFWDIIPHNTETIRCGHSAAVHSSELFPLPPWFTVLLYPAATVRLSASSAQVLGKANISVCLIRSPAGYVHSSEGFTSLIRMKSIPSKPQYIVTPLVVSWLGGRVRAKPIITILFWLYSLNTGLPYGAPGHRDRHGTKQQQWA